MDLIIYTGASDLSQAFVTATNDLTPVSEFPALVYGDTEPLTLRFTTDAAGGAPSWLGVEGHVLDVILGGLSMNGGDVLSRTSAFTYSAPAYSGNLYLATTAFADYLAGRLHARGFVFLQVRHTTPAGLTETLAAVMVPVQGTIPAANGAEDTPVEYATYAEVIAAKDAAEAAATAAEAAAASVGIPGNISAFAADPSSNGSFSASAWRTDLSLYTISQVDTALNLKQSVGPGLSSLTAPLIIAHRGGSVPSPEHCMAGYRLMAKYPTILLEADVVVLGDGTQGIMHDGTVDRTTLGTGANTQYDAALWRSLRMRTASANGSGTIYNVPTDTGPAMFDEFLSEFGNKRVLVVEVKTSGAGDLMRDTLLAHGITSDHVIVTAANDAALQPSRLAGYKTMYNVGSEVSAATVAALGHEWVALAASGVDQTRVDEFHNVGIKVAIYTVESHYLADRYIGYGVDAIFSDDPIWIARQTATRSTDPFFSLGRTHGSQDRAVSVDNTRYYLPTGKLFLGRSGNYTGQLQGWAYPLPTSVEITFSADFITSGSGTNAVGIFVGNSDFPFTSANSGSGDFAVLPEGYTLYLNKTGALTITKRTGISANSVTLGSQAGTAVTDGTTVQIRVRITATDLTIERLDVPTSLTVTNSDYRPLPYLQFGTLSIQAAFHTATVATYVP